MSKVRCPKCEEEGRDQKGNNATVYPDGNVFCHAGHGRISAKMEARQMESKVSIQDCMSEPEGHDPERKISEEIIQKYGIRCVYDTSTGKPKRTYYPYADREGKITGFKVRNIQNKDFFVVGKLNGLWGKQAAHKTPHGALIITEGEEDALAISEMLRNSPSTANDVVSVPNGASAGSGVDQGIQSDLDFIKRYSKVYLCLDSDEPGRATAKKLAGWLSGFVSDVRVVDVPHKDASACLMGGHRAEFAAAVKGTQQFRPEGIVHGSEISIQDLMRSVPEGFDTPYPDLNKKLHGVRKGEILTVCAGSGIGKSTLVKEIGYDLVTRHGLKVCHIALEDVVEATAASYVAMDNNVPSSRFRTDPGCIPMHLVETSMDRTVRKMYFFNHFGSIDSTTFKEKLFYYARSGVDFIILDHLSMVISGSDVQNERKEIDKIMTELAQMVVSTGVGLINVVHLKRRESRDSGKSLNEGGSVSLTDLRGSAALEQLSWGVLAMERDQQAEDGSEDFVELRVLKNRTWGYTGFAGRAKYVHASGRMVPVDDSLPETDPYAMGGE